MNNYLAAAVAVAGILAIVAAANAHPVGAGTADAENWQEHHAEMAELHQQLANGEIAQEQFWQQMSKEMAGCPMHAGGHMGGGMMG